MLVWSVQLAFIAGLDFFYKKIKYNSFFIIIMLNVLSMFVNAFYDNLRLISYSKPKWTWYLREFTPNEDTQYNLYNRIYWILFKC